MSKEKKLIPALRFPVFEKDGEWDKKKLGDIGEFVGGGTPSTSNSEYWDGDIQWYTPTEVKNGILNPSIRTITKEGLKNSSAKLLPKGTILITTRATIGDAAIAVKECTTNQGFQSLVVRESEDNKFWYYWIEQHKHELVRRSSGSTFKEIGKTEIKNIPTLSPNDDEQQKIASCLSSLDKLIAAHNQKLEALKNHKKGLMQNLFPQEGKKVPNYRFPDFEKDGKWVRKKLGDAANFINGRAYKKEELLTSGKYRVLRVGNFFTNNEWYYSDLELDEDKYCDNGDLLYAWSASFGPRIWKEEKVIYHYHIWKVIEKIGVDKSFLFVLLDFETENIKAAQARGLGMQHLTKSGIESWESTIPPSEKEQNKIASCLSVLDGVIIAQTEKIEQLQQHKKGLMQGLFPKTDNQL